MRLTFRDTLSMCFEKLNLFVIVSPKYLNLSTHSILLSQNNRSGKSLVRREENIISLLLAEFAINLLLFKYEAISVNSLFIFKYRSAREVDLMTKAASFTNSTVSASTAKGISFINKLKHKGPRMDPCGTPLETGFLSDS